VLPVTALNSAAISSASTHSCIFLRSSSMEPALRKLLNVPRLFEAQWLVRIARRYSSRDIVDDIFKVPVFRRTSNIRPQFAIRIAPARSHKIPCVTVRQMRSTNGSEF
jgi:hypothetical protein